MLKQFAGPHPVPIRCTQTTIIVKETMGLPYSAEKILGWRSQYEAMLRWHSRCEARHREDDTYNTDFVDALDHILVFFTFSYHLYDFVACTGCVDKEKIGIRINSNSDMRKCRDIANRIKHHTLARNPSVDADWSIGREYVPYGNTGEKLFFIAGNEKTDAIELVRACVRFWVELIESGVIREPPYPFCSGNG